jgi:hypothetical protein
MLNIVLAALGLALIAGVAYGNGLELVQHLLLML